MADHENLLAMLRRFAHTMTGRYDITDVLYELCDHAMHILSADGAGVSLFNDSDELRFVTATSETIVAAEKAQEAAGAGPCISSVAENRPVGVEDITTDDRWPGYRTRAEALGLRAVLGLPLALDGDRIGSMNVYSFAPRQWTDSQVAGGAVLADIAAAYVLNASELARARRTVEQLQHALDSRVVIEQAKGRLAGELHLSIDDAFERMRRHARSHNLTLRDVATAVVTNGPAAFDGLTDPRG